MTSDVQFDTDNNQSRRRPSKDDEGFRIVEWLQKKGIAKNESQAYWITLTAVAIIFVISIYFFWTA